jgi:hypothetical protein
MQFKSIIVGACLLAVLAAVSAGPAAAQRKGPAPAAKPPSPEELQKKRDAEAVDLEYRKALERSKSEAPAAKSDPWQNMRGPDDNAKR